MKVCYIYDDLQKYTKNYLTIKGLEKNGVEVIKIGTRFHNIALRNIEKFFKFLFTKRDYDVILIGMLGHFIVPLIAKLTKKPIVFDPFISLYSTVVEDRHYFSKKSPLGKFSLYLDRRSVLLSKKIILDTNEHIRYWTEDLKLPREKFKRVFIGADDEIFFPREEAKKKDNEFIVKFYGEVIPAQGVEIIIKAAHLLKEHKEIKFFLISGGGHSYKECQKLAKDLNITNLTFLKRVPLNQLPAFIEGADIMLGMFGNTKKFNTSIAHKVYQALAMRKPVITAESDGCKDLLVTRENVLLTKQVNPQSLCDAILELKHNKKLRDTMAKNGYETYKNYGTPKIIGREIKQILSSCI